MYVPIMMILLKVLHMIIALDYDPEFLTLAAFFISNFALIYTMYYNNNNKIQILNQSLYGRIESIILGGNRIKIKVENIGEAHIHWAQIIDMKIDGEKVKEKLYICFLQKNCTMDIYANVEPIKNIINIEYTIQIVQDKKLFLIKYTQEMKKENQGYTIRENKCKMKKENQLYTTKESICEIEKEVYHHWWI